jgi:hypothetical protein
MDPAFPRLLPFVISACVSLLGCDGSRKIPVSSVESTSASTPATTPTPPNDPALVSALGTATATELPDGDTRPSLTPSSTATSSGGTPAPTGRPGVYVNADPLPGRCSRTKCVPLCQNLSTKPHPKYPDWGWERGQSCVISDSPTALIAGGDPETATRNHGYAIAPRRCYVGGAPQTNPDRPPALDKTQMQRSGFTTRGAQLIDAYGNPFLPRAINNANGWYDTCAQYAALEALDNIAATGANAVRIGWAFDSIDPGGPDEGPPRQRVIGTNARLLAEVLQRSVELQLVPIVTFNDSTGQTDASWATKMADEITSSQYFKVLKAYEPYLLLGIANELNLPYEEFAPAYATAIGKLRARGYHGTLVITANEWGQGCETLLTFGPLLQSLDPQHNLLFDLHIYTYVHYYQAAEPNRYAGGEPERLSGCLNDLAALELPLLIGEFGRDHSSGPVAWETVVERANANGQGYAPWLWYGDTEYPQLNMSETWEGPLTEWGKQATADFALTSKKASIFQ